MSEREFETYLNLLARFLKLSPQQRAAIEKELRAHLEERLEELREKGFSREDAIETALAEFGDAAGLADDFAKATRGPIIRRRIMQTGIGTLAAAAAIALTFTFLLPENRQGVPERPQTLAEVDPTPLSTPGEDEMSEQARRAGLVAVIPEEAEKALERTVTIKVVDGTLGQVFDQLEETLDVSIRMAQPGRSDAHERGRREVTPEHSITFEAENVTGREALEKLDAALPFELTAELVQNGITVQAWRERPQPLITVGLRTHVYDVRDLLADPALEGDSLRERGESLVRTVNLLGLNESPSYLPRSYSMYDGMLFVRVPEYSHGAVQRALGRLRESREAREALPPSREEAEAQAVPPDETRMYDVRDLLAAGPEEGQAEALIRLVNAGSIQIEPETDRDLLETTFVVFDGVLTVRAPIPHQQKVKQTLSTLRETVRTRSRAEAHR